MGNSLSNDEIDANKQNHQQTRLKRKFQFNNGNLIFFAGTDKARVISEILEERGWSRTKDQSVTNFTIKWCLEHQVDWTQFQEGKQLINNIPGQLTFSDKINLWYTIRDYLQHRRTLDKNHLQTFLPMTFVLDDENEVTSFVRSYRKQSRTWICKPRYSYAGKGIYVLSGNSDLNAVFKFKLAPGSRLQYEPKFTGYLMQEYISRPLLIKNRKFDIRVHWLVAWTKPLLVFYNHNASVVRLSLNIYREMDFDRATHLTNLSVQEHHSRYPFAQESTGMTMNQLNHHFNQCIRPFNSKMCQDWVMTVMQERMQTIIRHVIRASKDKLTRSAGQFGLFGCDFLLDENFRIWLLEVNDNPGVGWGNSQLNTTTKPLFEETLNIVFECFEKYQNDEPILPIECLKNYQLIYNEDDDAEQLLRDDNQICTERLTIRYVTKESVSRTSFRRTLQRPITGQTSIDIKSIATNNEHIILPLVNTIDARSTSVDPNLPNSKYSVIDSIVSNSLSGNKTPASLSIVEPLPDNSSIINIASPSPFPFPSPSPGPTSIFTPIPAAVSTPIPAAASTPTPADVPGFTFLPLTLESEESIPLDSINDMNIIEESIEPLTHDDDIQLERLINPKTSGKLPKPQSSVKASPSTTVRPTFSNQMAKVKRAYSTAVGVNMQRKKHIDLTPMIIDNRRYVHRNPIVPPCTETMKKPTKAFQQNKNQLAQSNIIQN